MVDDARRKIWEKMIEWEQARNQLRDPTVKKHCMKKAGDELQEAIHSFQEECFRVAEDRTLELFVEWGKGNLTWDDVSDKLVSDRNARETAFKERNK